MSDNQTQHIELNIKEAKSIVAKGNSLDRLFSNKDFKKVILDDYLEAEAVRLVHLKADPNMQDPESQQSIISQMDAIGCLRSYFRKVSHQKMLSEKAIESDQQTLEEMREEEVVNNG